LPPSVIGGVDSFGRCPERHLRLVEAAVEATDIPGKTVSFDHDEHRRRHGHPQRSGLSRGGGEREEAKLLPRPLREAGTVT
jgi:hypothetical protein